MEGNICRGVICENAGGSEFFGANAVIDATGDASIMYKAGVPTLEGENYLTYIVHMYEREDIEKLGKTGDICKFRRWVNKRSDLLGKGHPKGMRLLKGVTCEDITDYVITGKMSILEYIKTLDKNSFDIMTVPTMPQLRTIRRIVGKCDFNAVDGETFADSIGACGDFRAENIGKHYEIPAGALYNENFPNLFAAGRIISAPKGDGWEVARVIPTCALTGEAAGRLAAHI